MNTEFKFTLQQWIEFTLDVGCPNNCGYCPQNVLLNEYYKNDYGRKSSMNLDDFKNILANIPTHIDIDFAGFGEPFINPQVIDMMRYAASQGYTIHLFSTLRGANIKQIEQLVDIPISSTVIHLPDADGIVNLKVNLEYKSVVSAFHSLGINNVEYMSIGNPHPELDGIIKKTIKIRKANSRSNTVKDGDWKTKVDLSNNFETDIQKEQPVICARRLYIKNDSLRPTQSDCAVVLPDGMVVPCCQDWGLKHPMGNLYNQNYDDIMNSTARLRFEDSMMCKNDDNIICRKCEWGVKWSEEVQSRIYTGR